MFDPFAMHVSIPHCRDPWNRWDSGTNTRVLSGARTMCCIPSGKSQCVESVSVIAAWLSGQCAWKLSIFDSFSVHCDTRNFFFPLCFAARQLARQLHQERLHDLHQPPKPRVLGHQVHDRYSRVNPVVIPGSLWEWPNANPFGDHPRGKKWEKNNSESLIRCLKNKKCENEERTEMKI